MINDYLHGPALTCLVRWCSEAEEGSDILTTSVIHAHLCLLWSNVVNFDQANVVRLLSSLCYVRNWHGFGLGLNRSEIEGTDGATLPDNEQRLLRFLQAQVSIDAIA